MKKFNSTIKIDDNLDNFKQYHYKSIILNNESMKHNFMQYLYYFRISFFVRNMRYNIQFCVVISTKKQFYFEKKNMIDNT